MTSWTEVISALGLGLLTSIYPCTMVMNLTGLSLLASSCQSLRRAVLSGIFYSLGRAFTYVCIGLLLSWAALSHVQLVEALQHYAGRLLGPALIIIGMFVCRLLRFGSGGVPVKLIELLKGRLSGMHGAFLVGAALGLVFCPASAALFFGSVVMGLASGALSSIALPAAFGIGTAMPVLVISVVSAGSLAALQTKLSGARWFTRKLPAISGALLILIGIYLSLRDIILA